MIGKIFRFLRRLALTIIVLGVVGGIGFFAVRQYRRHVPVMLVGSCLIFDIQQGEGESTELGAGRIMKNDIQGGTATIATYFMGFYIPLEVSLESLRSKGFIEVKCEEVDN
jgi:hypothetical protein